MSGEIVEREDTPTPTDGDDDTPTPTESDEGTADGTDDDSTGDTPGDDAAGDTDDDTPGFGAIVALVALLAAALLATRRRP